MNIESVLFVFFVICVIFIGWVPQGYMFKNLKIFDFDSIRDYWFYVDILKARFKRPLVKIMACYIICYSLFAIFNFISWHLIDG